MLDIQRHFGAAQAAARKIQESCSASQLALQSALVAESASAKKLAENLGMGSSIRMAEFSDSLSEAIKQFSAFEGIDVSPKLDPRFLSSVRQLGDLRIATGRNDLHRHNADLQALVGQTRLADDLRTMAGQQAAEWASVCGQISKLELGILGRLPNHLDGLKISTGLDRRVAHAQDVIAQVAAVSQDPRFQDFFSGLDRQLADMSVLTGRDQWNELLTRSQSVVDALNLPPDLTEGIFEFPDPTTSDESRQRVAVLILRLYGLFIAIGTHPACAALSQLSQLLLPVIFMMLGPATVSRQDFEAFQQRLDAEIERLNNSQPTTIATCAPEEQPHLALMIRAAPVYSESHSESKRLGRVREGTTITVLGCERRWCRVEYLDSKRKQFQNGWVYAKNLTAFQGGQ